MFFLNYINLATVRVCLLLLPLLISTQAFSNQSSFQRNVQKSLTGDNDDKQVFVRRIQRKKDIAFLHGIQIIDEHGQRYFVEEGYKERDALCQAFDFKEAFNSNEDLPLNTPMTSLTSAHQMVQMKRKRFVPYRKADDRSISMIEILPCRVNSRQARL